MNQYTNINSQLEALKLKDIERYFYNKIDSDTTSIIPKVTPFKGINTDMLYIKNNKLLFIKFMETTEDLFFILEEELLEVMNEEYELLKIKMEQLKLNIEYNYVFVMPYVDIDDSDKFEDFIKNNLIDKVKLEKILNDTSLIDEYFKCENNEIDLNLFLLEICPEYYVLSDRIHLNNKFKNLTYSPTMAIPCYTGKKFDSLSVPINDDNMRKYLEYINKIGKENFVYKHGLYGLLGEEEKKMQMPVCAAGKSKLIIKYDGSVYPCNFFQTEEYFCGNVFEEDLKEIWKNGKGFKKFRSYYLNENIPNECKNCKKHDNCYSGCRAWTKSYIEKSMDIKQEGDVRCGVIDAYIGA